MLLEVNDLNVYYGAIHALQGISFHVEKGEIVTLIGANGAGKSTTLNAISGIVRARGGSIKFKGEPITKSPAHDIVKMGVVQVPEGRQIFAPLTVKENLDMGAFTRSDAKGHQEEPGAGVSELPAPQGAAESVRRDALRRRAADVGDGPGLMSEPELLLLDEPSMGLAPLLVDEIFAIIEEINSQGTSILLVEQNAQMALSIADRAYVLETGRLVLEGSAQELAANPRVQEAYLGG